MSNNNWRKEFEEWMRSLLEAGDNPSVDEIVGWIEENLLNTPPVYPSSWLQVAKEKYGDGDATQEWYLRDVYSQADMVTSKRTAFLDGLSMCRGVIDAANRLFEFTEANLPPMTEDEETIINEIIKFKKVLNDFPALPPDTYTEWLKELSRFDHCPEFLIDDPTFIKRMKVTKVSDMEEGEGKQWAIECIERYEASLATPQGNDGWVSVEDGLPETIEGKDYSENVFAIVDGKMRVMAYYFFNAGQDSGWAWCDCGNNIEGDPEFDDDYNVTHWRPLSSPPAAQPPNKGQ